MSTVTINNQTHELAELKKNAEEAVTAFQATELELAFTMFGAEYIASAMRGMAHTIVGLADELERMTDRFLDANESA